MRQYIPLHACHNHSDTGSHLSKGITDLSATTYFYFLGIGGSNFDFVLGRSFAFTLMGRVPKREPAGAHNPGNRARIVERPLDFNHHLPGCVSGTFAKVDD